MLRLKNVNVKWSMNDCSMQMDHPSNVNCAMTSTWTIVHGPFDIYILGCLLMEASHQYRPVPENVSIHRVNNRISDIGGIRAGGRLRHVELRIQRIQFECVVMIRAGRSAHTHVPLASRA